MKATTEELVRELAAEMGTTTEYLWSVLVKQAPITGVTHLVVVGGWMTVSVLAFKLLRRKTTGNPEAERPQERYPELDGEVALLAWSGWATVSVLIFIIGTFEALEAIKALLNPEYWALNQILSKFGG